MGTGAPNNGNTTRRTPDIRSKLEPQNSPQIDAAELETNAAITGIYENDINAGREVRLDLYAAQM